MTEVEDDYDLQVPHIGDNRKGGERLEEREGQPGHFACLNDLDPSCGAGVPRKQKWHICIHFLSPVLKMYRRPGQCYLERRHPL
jgi:hypothetical protein